MRYERIRPGRFLDRPNRFIAHVEVDGTVQVCHVKNTGRCKELLRPGATVYVEWAAPGSARKTQFDLVAVENRGYVVNMDSQTPNRVFARWAEEGGYLPGLTGLSAETVYGASRFDFSYRRVGRKGFVEIKGVTLFDNAGMAYFPDAPTQRGARHLRELIRAREEGYEAGVCFVLQREDVIGLRPNDRTDPTFGDALREASAAGVLLTAVMCHVTPEGFAITRRVPVWPERSVAP